MIETEMKRVRVFATIREDVEQWIQVQVEKGRFRNRSHAIEYSLLNLIEEDKKGSQWVATQFLVKVFPQKEVQPES